MFQKGDFSQIDEKVFKEVFRELPHSKCDMAIVSASPFQASGVQNIGRSFIYFTSLRLMHSYWKEQELAQQVAFMPCLIALIKADNFDEAINFVDLVSELPGNAVKSTKKYLVILTPYIDQRLMQNKTGNFHVHIISGGETGSLLNRTIFFKMQA